MTSKPPAGMQRQPQRSLSGTGPIQRPTPNRSFSQQFQTSSSSIRKTESYVDLTSDTSEASLGRYGAAPRIGGSRLKLEISKDAIKGATSVVDSPKTIEVPSEPQPAPPIRGRPKLRFDGDVQQLQGSSDGHSLSSVRGGENITGQAPFPMPRRPGLNAHPSGKRENISATQTVVKKDARPKPYVLETPSDAPHYPLNGHADFFPWTGNHPEDQFTEHVIRHGYFDKMQTTQNETGATKLSTFPALKHKSGLQTLSSLFTTILAQRRTHGQITSNPTFKPPPRVTLTDTKRETWLRDLANPTISLRRLSRTIPHGIRGKVLLEQCLSKKVPTERAVWLAKCVGANEIRAFKRKGASGAFAMGGEAKWIRDWTTFVEQFIESIMTSCGEKDWKERILYAVRLAAHLYSEHLLDREHYMDWLSASIESCPLAKVPMWLLITQVYWRDLLKARKYGRRLVASLCAHLQAIHDTPDSDLLSPLVERLSLLLKGLMERYPASFVSPKAWGKYNKILALYLYPNIHNQSCAYASIETRNRRLVSFGSELTQTQSHVVVSLLDKSLLQQTYSPDISKTCWNLTTDRTLLVRTVLEWATSFHRPGVAKIYIAARILRTWSRHGIEINDEILNFLGFESHSPGLNKAHLYHLVSELTRSNHFSTSKYITWLIARGGIRGPADLAEDGPPSTRLLAELPIHHVPESINRLRRTLLGRAQIAAEDETEEIEIQIKIMKALLPSLIDQTAPALEQQSDQRISRHVSNNKSGLSRAIKSEMGIWLRNFVSAHAARLKTSATWKQDATTVALLPINTDVFNSVRQTLEEIEDLSMLADVLQIMSNSDDIQVLASAADTLSFNLHAFAAIGALKDLFELLLVRMRSLIELQDLDVTILLRSLSGLAARIPGEEAVAFQLSQDLINSSRRTAADACSPVSDYMADVLQNSESDFSDEIEKVLASGTSMDQHTLGRFFLVIVARMEATWYKSPQLQRNCAMLLMQLKSFDAKQFRALMSSWLRQTMETPARPSLAYVIGPLIAIGCVEFGEVMATSAAVLDSVRATINSPIPTRIAFEALALLIGGPKDKDFMTVEDGYYLGVKRLQAQHDLPLETLTVLRRAIELSSPSMQNEHEAMLVLCQSQQMQGLLQRLVLVDLEAVLQTLIKPLLSSSDPDVLAVLSSVTRCLLYPDMVSQPSTLQDHPPIAILIESALRSANHLTLPFCQLELQAIFAAEKLHASIEESEGSDCREAFERAVDAAVARNNTTWTNIIRTLDVQTARNLCQRAQSLFLALVPNSQSTLSAGTMVENQEQAKRFLFVVEATAYSIEASSTQQFAARIVEKLNEIWQIAEHGDPQKGALDVWLPLMLNFITVHIPKFDTSKTNSELRARMLLSLSSLILELQRQNHNATLLEQLFDVAILLVDDLPEEARTSCVRALKDKTSDARIHYIFGYSSMPTEWLQLNQKGKLVPYPLRRWEILSEPTPNVGENDTSLSLTLFQARKL